MLNYRLAFLSLCLIACNPDPKTVDDDGDGISEADGDCDDVNDDISPDAIEICDGIDNDCDGLIDDEDDDLDTQTTTAFYTDSDSDGFGDATTETLSCVAGEGQIEDNRDCDDSNETINPDAVEVCDGGIDNDCDNLIDIDDDDLDTSSLSTYYADTDGDGYGDSSMAEDSCTLAEGFADNDLDCDDTSAEIMPDALEVCDGIDNDCDDLIDDSDDDTDLEGTGLSWYEDYDGDGYGDPFVSLQACDLPVGYVDNNLDCDDIDATLNQDDVDTDGFSSCDMDCDDNDAALNLTDADGDGFNTCDMDCDDNDAALNLTDADGDGFSSCDMDCDDNDAALNLTDADGDGYSTCTADCDDNDASLNNDDADGDMWSTCAGDCDDNDAMANLDDADMDGYSTCDSDCDDADPAANLDDSDGDGYSTCPGESCYTIEMNDSFGDGWNGGFISVNLDGALIGDYSTSGANSIETVCASAGELSFTYTSGSWESENSYSISDASGVLFSDGPSPATGSVFAINAGTAPDCNDTDPAIHPDATEICDSIDNDCDAQIDDNDANVDVSTGAIYYEDWDSDGYGDLNVSLSACEMPMGYVLDATDCDDIDPLIHPMAVEICDSIDNDCDAQIDDADSSVDLSTGSVFFEDADGDSYGNINAVASACTAPVGYVADSSDCNDADTAINPGAVEVCDSIDNDCDGNTDDADTDVDTSTGSVYYEDYDADGYGDINVTFSACSTPTGYVSDDTDCNDVDDTVNPGAFEVCDGLDNDCDGSLGSGSTFNFNPLDESQMLGNRARGGVFVANESKTVSEFGMDLTVPAGEMVTWYIYESADISGTYDQVFAQDAMTTGSGHESTGDIQYAMSAGHYYIFAIGWSTPSMEFFYKDDQSTSSSEKDTGWGQMLYGYYYDNGSNPGVTTTLPFFHFDYFNISVSTGVEESDSDGDGYMACEDCDDTNTDAYELNSYGECQQEPPAASTSSYALSGPTDMHGYKWYLGAGGATCDEVCTDLGGSNLASQAASDTSPYWMNNCNGAYGITPNSVIGYFFQNDNAANWSWGPGNGGYRTLGYGYQNAEFHTRCTNGSGSVGTFPGELNYSSSRNLVCPCF